MDWFNIIAPLMVISLMSMIVLFVVTSTAAAGARRRRRPFPPTRRDIAATGRLWRQRWRHVLPYQRSQKAGGPPVSPPTSDRPGKS
jgi:hypothetical protein